MEDLLFLTTNYKREKKKLDDDNDDLMMVFSSERKPLAGISDRRECRNRCVTGKSLYSINTTQIPV